MKGPEVLFIWIIVKLLAGLQWNCLQLNVIARVKSVHTFSVLGVYHVAFSKSELQFSCI